MYLTCFPLHFVLSEFTEDFQWGISQVEEKSSHLIGKGYNAKKIVVKEGDAARLLYTDAQVCSTDKLGYSIQNPYIPCGRFWKSVPHGECEFLNSPTF